MDTILDEEELLAKHRRERKDLQAEIQRLKKSVSKGDKKRKKEVTDEIAKLETDLNSRQEDELAALESSDKPEVKGETPSNATTASTLENGVADMEAGENELVQKKSKAQKRREKKQTKGRERDLRIQEQEIENRQGPRHVELVAVAKMLKEKGLSLHEIAADGNCMYNAVGHQLSLRSQEVSCTELREKTANYMREHPDNFLPFLTHPDTDEMMTPEQFSTYCDKTAKSPVWGGQLELQALSEVFDLPIQVLQVDVQPLLFGENKTGPPITLVYQRHAYRLGEHYNSVKPKTASDDSEEEEDQEEKNG